MKKKHKVYIGINLVSLFFVLVSFVSVTLAWFAYSGLLEASIEVDVKSWYIELKKDGDEISNNIVVSSSGISPGMDIVNEEINIKNLGDSDAQIKYSIKSVRILDEVEDYYEVNESLSSDEIEDIIAHEYPFKINMSLKKGYILAEGDQTIFQVTISWPLDSDDDSSDSYWGSQAYEFTQDEQDLKDLDENYQIRPPIEVIVSVTAEQYLEEDTTSDILYNLGDDILFDVVNNETCLEVGSNCYKAYVIDVNNKLGDEVVTLMLDPSSSYSSSSFTNYSSNFSSLTTSWTVSKRNLLIEDILRVISTDIYSSVIVRPDLSDVIIGTLNNQTRIDSQISLLISGNGYYKIVNSNFDFLVSNTCYWINEEYDTNNAFAFEKIDVDNSKVYSKLKTSTCNIVPVIEVSKLDL